MSGFTTRDAQQMLSQTHETQDKTKEAIDRMRQKTAESEAVGSATLEELRRQGEQMDEINNDVDAVCDKLDKASSLQNQFDRWAGNWLGGKRRAAEKEATAQARDRELLQQSKATEVFEHSKFESLSRKWKTVGLFLCTPDNSQAPDLFDPALQASIPDTRWQIDFSASEVDAEGWTYGFDFASLNKGKGSRTAGMTSYVRRRKWRFTEGTGKKAEILADVRERNNARVAGAAAKAAGSSQADKIGYVPRNAQKGLTASGLTATKKGVDDDDLDAGTRAGLAKVKENDAEIDAGLDEIGNSLDRLAAISGAMNEEVRSQNTKLDSLTSNMERAADKQAMVNARLKRQLK